MELGASYSLDLLDSALALGQSRPETQANLRRAISTAYYGLFHLLIEETCANWIRTEQRHKLARAFDHRNMAAASKRYADRHKRAAQGSAESHLHIVTEAFCRLQDRRHSADYDLSESVSYADAELAILIAREAFSSWASIRDEQIAHDYLFALLFKDRA